VRGSVRTILRSGTEFWGLWRAWLPLVLLTGLLPLLGFAMPLIEKRLIDDVLLPRRLGLLASTLGLYAGLWLAMTISQVISAPLRTYLGEQLTLRLRERLFGQCETLSLAFSHREHSGRTMALFVNDVPNVASLYSTTLLSGIGSLLSILIGIAVMLRMNWQLAVVAGLLPPLLAGVATRVTRPLRPMARQAQEKAAELTERLQENLLGLREVAAFGQAHAQSHRFTTTLQELLRIRMRVTLMETAIQTGQSLFSLTVTLVIMGYGGYLVIRGQATVGMLVAMRSLFGMVFQPAGQMVGLFSSAQKALASADRVCAFLDETPRVRERVSAATPRAVRGEVTFDRVSFAYEPGRPVLHGVSLTAHPGEMIALVGPSGTGKSTLVSLIARFYDPTAGQVLLDGIDLRDLTLAGLRSQIGVVFQDTFLFATTIRENIAFGRAGAGEAAIVAAARAANAWEFIEALPAGLETPVGERGAQLSEGQKQRLAIARALLRDPRILILDEPTSALDARSEHLLQAALENLLRGRTSFVIAHRLATVQRADRIVVLEDGRIVEQGTHHQLLQRRGLYRELFELQFGITHPPVDDRAGVALTATTGSAPQDMSGLPC
jgi:ABC-type multidrug transport system fused ATPase/permease subunit